MRPLMNRSLRQCSESIFIETGSVSRLLCESGTAPRSRDFKDNSLKVCWLKKCKLLYQKLKFILVLSTSSSMRSFPPPKIANSSARHEILKY
jgi:hypothetical protein